MNLLQVGDRITTRYGDWMIVRSLEFVYHGDDPQFQAHNWDYWYVSVYAGQYAAELNWSIGDFWRVERNDKIIWQSDLPAIDPLYADLPMWADTS